MLLTIRLIKSFEYRTFKNLILNIEGDLLVSELATMILLEMKTAAGCKPFLSNSFDCLKLYVKAHGSKTTNLIVNLDHEELIMEPTKYLIEDYKVENETEISFFNRKAYEAFKLDPQVKW